jgi:predicted MFS family arabinose efflux permease
MTRTTRTSTTAQHATVPAQAAPEHVASEHATVRRTLRLSKAQAYALSAYMIGLCLFASVVPSPLYRSYSAMWHLTPLTITLVFAIYSIGVLAALLLLGRVSDQVGRRPVLLAAITGLGLSAVLFIAADSLTWLFVARAVQGVATGAAMSTASAALLDLHRRRDPVSVGLTNGVASMIGVGLGSLASALIVSSGTAPRVLPYVMLLVMFGIAFLGALLMPEPVTHRQRLDLHPQRPSVPAGIRHRFMLGSFAVLASWSLGGLLFALGNSLSGQLLHTSNVVAATFGIFGLGLAASAAQLVTRRTPAWAGASLGGLVLAIGGGLIVWALESASRGLFIAGILITGAGFGVAFLGGLRNLSAGLPHAHRAAVMSSFYIVAYLSLSVPAVIAGVILPHEGLSTTFELFAAITGGVALVMSVEAYRTRPTAKA